MKSPTSQPHSEHESPFSGLAGLLEELGHGSRPAFFDFYRLFQQRIQNTIDSFALTKYPQYRLTDIELEVLSMKVILKVQRGAQNFKARPDSPGGADVSAWSYVKRAAICCTIDFFRSRPGIQNHRSWEASPYNKDDAAGDQSLAEIYQQEPLLPEQEVFHGLNCSMNGDQLPENMGVEAQALWNIGWQEFWQHLKERERQILSLYIVDGLTQGLIANKLGISELRLTNF